jgi:plasmid stability protein
MDTTILNLDAQIYRELKARAALAGKTVGEVLNEAMTAYLARPEGKPKERSLRDLGPEPFPDGNEHLSEEIDAVVGATKGRIAKAIARKAVSRARKQRARHSTV